ncbi:hypothetical protein A3206_04255 [Candidatus Methanomassiliicoccus intestinalis]|uniref:Uncharacterized protein n=1 Tax=Methanomassiliicoccus intestinalis (strain Issoire-Mx1) TaxID=1295009 RepID=R9TCC1_METII|nr:hypothetical protein [Candidatus Methanomassiliicoccus intestinalis]AGN27118.1 hypothetical protein MMINT_18410 [Candidatus Methanomassiliicoccus intestinalis Issoire-Mx1]TQS80914.1 MAG: hypothetical protein A3206_04255 [Candidatus Methanomassiliicoccus intestinalis]
MLEIYIQYSGSSAVLQYLIFLKKSKELIKIKPALAGLLPERSNGIRCRRYARHYLIRAKERMNFFDISLNPDAESSIQFESQAQIWMFIELGLKRICNIKSKNFKTELQQGEF